MDRLGQRTLASTLFHLLPEGVWDGIRARMHERTFEPGEALVEQGSIEPDFHVIVEGTVAVQAVTPRGERHELGRLGFGECVGEMALLTGEPASADVVAVTPVRAYSASQAHIGSLGELRSQLIEALSLILASRLRDANDRLLAKQAARVHLICSSPEDAAALAQLPEAIARTTGERALCILGGEGYRADGATPGLQQADLRVVESPGAGALESLVAQASRDYDDIVVLARENELHADATDATSILHVMREDAGRLSPSAHSTPGQAIAISDRPWTVPSLRSMSEAAGRPVVGAVRRGTTGLDGGAEQLARLLTGRRVGVAFGAGAAKGLAHLGVLRALRDMHIPIDVVSGCSIGSAVASGVAAGRSVEELTQLVSNIASKAIRPTLPLYSFLSSGGVRREMQQVIGDVRIEDLDLPLAVVAVDIYRRSEVTFTSGQLWPRMLASVAIPGVYPAVSGFGTYFVDGGILNPVPVRQARDLGAGIVIGVRLTATRTSPRESLDFRPGRPFAIEAMIRSFEIMQNRISEISHEHADVNMEPVVDGTGGIRDFKRVDEFGELGYEAAMTRAPLIREALPYVGGAAS